MAPLYSRYIAAKYAGQWGDYPGEAWTVRMQRRVLSSRWWTGPVTVYGDWPTKSSNVVPFFTSMLSEEQIRRAARERKAGEGIRALFVGRLSASKNVHVLIEAAAALKKEGICLNCSIVGEGPEAQNLRALAARLGVSGQIEFAGGVPLGRVLDYYASSDALVLTSQTEGWPKVVAEGMAFGLVCIASNRGFIPQMLADGRGIAVPPGDTKAVVDALRELGANPGRFEGMRAKAASWSRAYSLEGLRDAIRNLLCERWGVELS
ncbi:MAG TPA: glycosyltransferase, partial [Bryobacteraceae bacterium]